MIQRYKKGAFLLLNLIVKLLIPCVLSLSVETGAPTFGSLKLRRPVYRPKSDLQKTSLDGVQGWIPFSPTTTTSSTLRQPQMTNRNEPLLTSMKTPNYSHTMVHYYFIPETPALPQFQGKFPKQSIRRRHTSMKIRPQVNQFYRQKQDVGEMCDGKGNLLQDLGVLAILSGGVGTLMGIFSASYLSMVGNTISIISGILSLALGIPSAIITYLAVSDRLSYTVANILSLLSFANTFYGIWSVDFGNRDILLSQFANLVGLFSLGLSIITAFPKLFDSIIIYVGKLGSPTTKREVDKFVARYGCDQDTPTFYEYSESLIAFLNTL